MIHHRQEFITLLYKYIILVRKISYLQKLSFEQIQIAWAIISKTKKAMYQNIKTKLRKNHR